MVLELASLEKKKKKKDIFVLRRVRAFSGYSFCWLNHKPHAFSPLPIVLSKHFNHPHPYIEIATANVFGAYFANSLSKRSAALLLELPYSRKVESEADTVGMKFISRACFDPTKASMVWKNMPALTDKDLEYLYTHPSNETRYESLQEQLPSAYDERAKSNCDDRSKREVRSFKKAVHHSIRVTG